MAQCNIKEKKQTSIKVNYLMNLLLTISSFIFPLITFPYVSRILLPSGTGRVSFATSVLNYFSMFAQLGIPTYGIRACAKIRDNKEELSRTVQEIFFINLITSSIAYIAFIVSLALIPRFTEDKTLFLIVSSTIIFNCIGMEWLYKALEKYTYITVRSMIFKIIALLAMFVFIHKQSDYVIYGAITIFAASASNIFNFLNLRNIITIKPVRKYNFKHHLKPILLFFAMSCAITIYTNLDTVMIGFMKTDVETGCYNAAIKIKSILSSVVGSLAVVLLPRVSYYVEKNLMKEFYVISKKAINFTVLLATPMVVYFMIFAKEGIFLLSGDEYRGAILPMIILMPTVLLIGLSNIMGLQILVPLGKEKIVLYSTIVGAVVDLTINFILIPPFASVGAAIGTLFAEFSVLIFQFIFLHKMVWQAFKNIKILKICAALLVAVVLSFWVKEIMLGYFLKLLISALLFFGSYVVILTFEKEQLVIEIEKQLYSKILGKPTK